MKTATPHRISFILVDGKPDHYGTYEKAAKVRDTIRDTTGKRKRIMKVLNCPSTQAERIGRDEEKRKARV